MIALLQEESALTFEKRFVSLDCLRFGSRDDRSRMTTLIGSEAFRHVQIII